MKQSIGLLSDRDFFCNTLDTDIPALSDIAQTYQKKGLAAAEHQVADYIRKALRPDLYFQTPYYPRENLWARADEDDFAVSERVMRGELISCGAAYLFPDGNIQWEFNPTKNQYLEWTWQLSRHHEWRCLGRCYRETGDERYAKAFVKFLMSWYEQAPCPKDLPGNHTSCWRTIEAGIRMTKIWHYAFHAFYRSPAMTDHVICTYLKSIREHAYRLKHFSTSHNWLIMEMAGLAHIGMIYRCFRDADAWATEALRRLDEELDRQLYPDSFQYELTTNYHGVVLENYRYVIETARIYGYPLPENLIKRLENGYDLYVKLCQPDLRTPALNDGGNTNVSEMLETALSYFPDREDFQYFATKRAAGREPSYRSIALPYSGMAVMRTGWHEKDIYLFMESAPFGKAHQHEDKLNVILHAYGKSVLPDVGNYHYDSSEMRSFVSDTRAHNCAMVDGLSQNRRKTYCWHTDDVKKRSDLQWHFTDDTDTAEGIYDEGFGDALLPVTHKRKVIFFKKGIVSLSPFVLVIDRLTASDQTAHDYTVQYQAARAEHTLDGHGFVQYFGDGVTLGMLGSLPCEVIIGQTEPYLLGWRPRNGISDNNIAHYPTPCVRFTKKAKHARIVTLLYPSDAEKMPIREIIASPNIDNTHITLVTSSGEHFTVDEADYPIHP